MGSTIRIVSTREDFYALRPAWERLESQAFFPMQQFIWAEACVLSYTRPGELRFMVLEENGTVLAIAPLVQRTGQRAIEIVGLNNHLEPTEMVYAHPDVLQPMAHALIDLGLPLHLRRLPSDSEMVRAIRDAFRRRGVCLARYDFPWPWLTLGPTGESVSGRYSRRRRTSLRRSRRQAEALGDVRFEICAPTPETLPALLEEAYAIEAAGWKGANGTAMASAPEKGDFFRTYSAAACRTGILRLCFLRIGGRPAAMLLAVETADRFWMMKMGYDEHFEACSPGSLILLEALQYASDRGFKTVGFHGTMEDWKKKWTQETLPCVVLRGYPYTRTGMQQLALDTVQFAAARLRGSWNSLRKTVPPPDVTSSSSRD